MLLAQGTNPTEIIDAAAAGDTNRLLVAVCGVLLALFLGACGIIVKLLHKLEAERKAADAACDAQRDKHEAEVRKLYGDLLKLSMRVQRAVERMANIPPDEDEEG